jgi:hypothetical protein
MIEPVRKKCTNRLIQYINERHVMDSLILMARPEPSLGYSVLRARAVEVPFPIRASRALLTGMRQSIKVRVLLVDHVLPCKNRDTMAACSAVLFTGF